MQQAYRMPPVAHAPPAYIQAGLPEMVEPRKRGRPALATLYPPQAPPAVQPPTDPDFPEPSDQTPEQRRGALSALRDVEKQQPQPEAVPREVPQNTSITTSHTVDEDEQRAVGEIFAREDYPGDPAFKNAPRGYSNWIFTSFRGIPPVFIPGTAENILGGAMIQFAVFQEELAPTTKRKHIQGYVELKGRKTLGSVLSWSGFRGVWWKPRKGTQKQAVLYCMKKDTLADPKTKPTIIGKPRAQGDRSDLISILEAVLQGATKLEMLGEFQGQAFRHLGMIDRAQRSYLGYDKMDNIIRARRRAFDKDIENAKPGDEANFHLRPAEGEEQATADYEALAEEAEEALDTLARAGVDPDPEVLEPEDEENEQCEGSEGGSEDEEGGMKPRPIPPPFLRESSKSRKTVPSETEEEDMECHILYWSEYGICCSQWVPNPRDYDKIKTHLQPLSTKIMREWISVGQTEETLLPITKKHDVGSSEPEGYTRPAVCGECLYCQIHLKKKYKSRLVGLAARQVALPPREMPIRRSDIFPIHNQIREDLDQQTRANEERTSALLQSQGSLQEPTGRSERS